VTHHVVVLFAHEQHVVAQGGVDDVVQRGPAALRVVHPVVGPLLDDRRGG
jgi:hypothetical protein